MTSLKKIQVWFDFASTYTYLSVMRIEELAEEHSITIEWKPFVLGAIFNQMGWNTSPFNIYKIKGEYMWRDMERLCRKYNLAFQRPQEFPKNGMLPARIVCANSAEPWCPRFIKETFRQNFGRDQNIAGDELNLFILNSLGLKGTEIIKKAIEPENKTRLKIQTEQAMKLKIFGAPTFIIGEELFWGNDRLEDAIEYCNALYPEY